MGVAAPRPRPASNVAAGVWDKKKQDSIHRVFFPVLSPFGDVIFTTSCGFLLLFFVLYFCFPVFYALKWSIFKKELYNLHLINLIPYIEF